MELIESGMWSARKLFGALLFLQMQGDKPARRCSVVSQARNKQVLFETAINLFSAILLL